MPITLAQARDNRGELVAYRSPATREITEHGRIAGVAGRMVLVRYRSSPDPILTHPDNLELIGDTNA
ncbi:hypothetical protein [Rhodococcus sp. UNC363MFTsu5.1]|uniref:hypothetical protein n=1 Tax=Rhodococcus sp. UNC363MFTsu5.1 TaxID=1449069 RepID=UPI000483C5B6|nr:hypothetical protein [Rhodococcus sp. UNC363MFTsu5.1]